MDNYRCYTFNNCYLTGIHPGIQTAHSQTSMMLKYLVGSTGSASSFAVISWAENPVTICLNGGNNESMLEIERLLLEERRIPWCAFREDEQSLGRLLTSIAVILPESTYKDAADIFKASGTTPPYDKEDGLFLYSEKIRISKTEQSIMEKIIGCQPSR